MQIVLEAEEELGYVDSIFGRGTWTRVTDGVFKYVEMRIHSFPVLLSMFTYALLLVAGGPRTG